MFVYNCVKCFHTQIKLLKVKTYSQTYQFLVFCVTTHLTDVTVDMEAAVQSYYPDRLLLTLFRHDGLTAN